MCFRFSLPLAFLFTLPVHAQTFTDASDLLPSAFDSSGPGVTIGDFDGDGRLDLGPGSGPLLQREGRFEQVLFEGFEIPLGSVVGDVDNDGLPDVFILDGFEPEIYQYLPAREDFAPFAAGGLNVEVPLVQGSILLDYDRDGILDALIGDDGGVDRLYRGLGAGAFEEVSDRLPQLERGDYGMMAADYDRDGDPDVYVGLCAGITDNLLYRNDGTAFIEVAAAAGVDDARAGWGVFWLDFDNDGWQDLFVANMPDGFGGDPSGQNNLFRNNGDGTFTDVADAAGVAGRVSEVSWNATVGDFDNDGWQDLFVANMPSASRLYHNDGDGTFTEITEAAGIPNLTGVPVASGDVNDDGWLDLYMPRGDGGGDALLFNDGGENGWLMVDLTGAASNRGGIGARIEVAAGDLSMFREITAGDGFMSQSHGLKAHFGLGTATSANVTVRWPSGTVETIEGVAANQKITVVEGLGINQPPAMFGLASPSDGTVLPLGEDVTLEWEAAADPESEAVSYTVYLAAPDGADQTFETTEPTLIVPASALSAEGTYHWAVVATDGHTLRTSLDPFRFTNKPDVATETQPEQPTLSLEVWPNPAREAATVQITVPTTESVTLEAFDALGRRVWHRSLGAKAAGSYAERVDLSGLGAGIYVVQVVGSESGSTTARLVQAGH